MIKVRNETILPPELFLSVREVEVLLKEMLELFGWTSAGLDVRLVDDAIIAEINELHLRCTGPTNVLSFPSGEAFEEDASDEDEFDEEELDSIDPGQNVGAENDLVEETMAEDECAKDGSEEALADGEDEVWIGEMVLSVDTLMRECHLYGQPPREHFCRLCAHSLLHLLGFDHGPEMEALTDEAVTQCS